MHPYSTASYAKSLRHLGEEYLIPEWGTHILLREIPGCGASDASGTYPIAILRPDADLPAGLARMRALGLVSITFVVDDFHRPPLVELQRHLDLVRPYKTHYVLDNSSLFAYSRHHRYEVRRARRKVTVGRLDLLRNLSAWNGLWETLARRHNLTDRHAFPPDHFAALGELTNVLSIGAWDDEKLLAAHIWVRDARFVHSHLAASSDEGYRTGAAYAVYDESIRLFADAELVNLGGAAGVVDNTADGLALFKKGFSNTTAEAYLCGAILDSEKYAQLSARRNSPSLPGFFPAYRYP